jgi:uncharacterized damage-inducible protein DinB
MTTTREFCVARRKAESAAFVKVLKAMPKDRLDYQPDPKARTASALSTLIAGEEQALLELIEKGSIEWTDPQPLTSTDQIVALFEKSHAAVNDRLEKLDDAAWERKVKFVLPGGGVWEDTLAEFVWGFLFDQIHHRGQLSTYLRPMGGKVPSIYGPSADDSGH